MGGEIKLGRIIIEKEETKLGKKEDKKETNLT